MSKEKLEKAGRSLYGRSWQTQLSERLTNHLGQPLDVRRVQYWVAGTVPVPAWVWPQIIALAKERKEEIEEFLKINLHYL